MVAGSFVALACDIDEGEVSPLLKHKGICLDYTKYSEAQLL
jgi:hypothetical protein